MERSALFLSMILFIDAFDLMDVAIYPLDACKNLHNVIRTSVFLRADSYSFSFPK